jgi:hypothetical protein
MSRSEFHYIEKREDGNIFWPAYGVSLSDFFGEVLAIMKDENFPFGSFQAKVKFDEMVDVDIDHTFEVPDVLRAYRATLAEIAVLYGDEV